MMMAAEDWRRGWRHQAAAAAAAAALQANRLGPTLVLVPDFGRCKIQIQIFGNYSSSMRHPNAVQGKTVVRAVLGVAGVVLVGLGAFKIAVGK